MAKSADLAKIEKVEKEEGTAVRQSSPITVWHGKTESTETKWLLLGRERLHSQREAIPPTHTQRGPLCWKLVILRWFQRKETAQLIQWTFNVKERTKS